MTKISNTKRTEDYEVYKMKQNGLKKQLKSQNENIGRKSIQTMMKNIICHKKRRNYNGNIKL